MNGVLRRPSGSGRQALSVVLDSTMEKTFKVDVNPRVIKVYLNPTSPIIGETFRNPDVLGPLVLAWVLQNVCAANLHDCLPGFLTSNYEDMYTEALAKMGRNTDFFSFGYNADRGDLDHKATLERLYTAAGNKRIGIHEIGTPTAARVGGSEAAQVAFVNLIFDLAAQHASQLEFISYYQAFDEDPAVTSVWLPAMFPDWSDEMQQDGLAWFGSLGLHRFDGAPKPAWATFKQRVKEFRR